MRSDLLRLTPEALAQLANVGLLKRAQRELAGGYVPTLTLDPDGRLRGVFPDQVSTEFAPAAGLKEASCSCGAALCRHRLALVLHYAAQSSNSAGAAELPVLPGFAELDEATLQAQLAASVWARVERELKQGIRIEVERSAAPGQQPVYSARLPHATARFYAAADLGFARCDCVAQQRCEHIALGALALARASAAGLADTRMAIELQRGERRETGFDRAPIDALLEWLGKHGLAHSGAQGGAMAAVLTHALQHSRALGATWLTLCLEDLEQWLDSYQRRSARFAWSDGLALLRELHLRCAVACGAGGELSARSVLGLSEALETPLDRLSLLSLGMRVDSDGAARHAQLAVVDTDTQTVLCLHKSWERPADTSISELALLDQQRIAGGLRLGRLASGSLVTTTAKRRANGELRLGQSFAGKASIGTQNGDWSALRPPLLIESRDDYLRQQQLAAPAELSPRTALPGFHVLRCSDVLSLTFDPARQQLHAMLADPSGECWQLQREYASATPGALDALAAVLAQARTAQGPLYVAGVIRRNAIGLTIEPWALSCGGIVVPDLSPSSGALASVPMFAACAERSEPLADFLQQLDDALCDVLREGWQHYSATSRARLTTLCARCAELGLAGEGKPIGSLLRSLLQRLATTDGEPLAALNEVLGWSALARHALSELDAR